MEREDRDARRWKEVMCGEDGDVRRWKGGDVWRGRWVCEEVEGGE